MFNMSLSAIFLLPYTFLILFHFIAGVLAQGYDYGFQVEALLKRQSPGPVIVTGARPLNGTIPFRPEIRQLQQEPDKWTLYILALSLLQYTNQSEALSYYQIAGIHGVPWQAWNDVQATPGNAKSGYCTHVSILFLTWHRPYLALYEQVLYNLVQSIASWYPDPVVRRRLQAAAIDFRIPYMDWAAKPPNGQGVLPSSVGSNPNVNISGPNGPQIIANPLYNYMFKPLNASIFIEHPYDLWPSTVRAPTTNDSQALSNNTRIALTLNQNFPSFQQRLYNLFSNYKNYSSFSNEAWIPHNNPNAYDSLESLHDTIHSLAGLYGHMSFIPFSAFDPIFFLHHCTVDRLFAMWQVLYPDSWIVPTPATMNSFTTSAGEIQDSTTPLTPFYATPNGTFWTSDMVRDPTVFGYTYADVAGASFLNGTGDFRAQEKVKTAVNTLYGQSSIARLAFDAGNQRRNVTQEQLKLSFAGTSPPTSGQVSSSSGELMVNNHYREWVANIHAEKETPHSTFFVHAFLDDPPEDSGSWSYAPNLVGTMSIFASPRGSDMDMGGVHASGTVPLTSALEDAVTGGHLRDMSPQSVRPFLMNRLKFGILRSDGAVLHYSEVPGLGIRIASFPVQAPASRRQLPSWKGTDFHFDLI